MTSVRRSNAPASAYEGCGPSVGLLLDMVSELQAAGGDVAALGHAVMDQARQGLQADVGALYLSESGGSTLVARMGLVAPSAGMPYSAAGLDPEASLVEDADAWLRAEGAKACRVLPLHERTGELLGALALGSTQRSSFDPDQEQLMLALAYFTAMCMEGLKARECIRGGEEQLRVALEVGGLGTWRCDLKASTFHMDEKAREQLGFDSEQIGLDELLQRCHPDDVERLRGEMARQHLSSSGEISPGLEFRVIRPDSSVRWLMLRSRAVQSQRLAGDAESSVCIGISADITQRKATEHSLQQVANDMELAQAMTQVGCWRVNLENMNLYCSSEMSRIFELNGDSLDLERFVSLLHPDDRARVLQAWEQAIRGGPPYDIEYRIIAGARMKWIRAKAQLEFDSTGKILSCFGTVQDVTDRKSAELALREAQQRYESLFSKETNAIGQYRIIYDERGRPMDYIIEKVNQAYARIMGVPKEEIEGCRATEKFPHLKRLDIDLVARYGRIALQTGEESFEIYDADSKRWALIYAYSPHRDEVISLITDVTAQKQAEVALRDSEAKLRATFEQAAVGIVLVDISGRFLRTNSKFSEMTGYSPAELEHLRFTDLTLEADRDLGVEDFRRMIAGEIRSFSVEKRYRRKDAAVIWVRITASAVLDPQTGAYRYNVSIVEDITAYRDAEQRAREAALHDPLTNIPNRRLVFEYAAHMVAATQRRHGQGALLFIDLDRFKPINDVYGHEVGDRLLEEVARRLLSCVRGEDLVGRLGGDEFVIVLQHLEEPHHAVAVAHHVIEQVGKPVNIRELTVSVTPSVGISLFPQHGTDVDALVHAADLAMYEAKKTEAGTYAIYSPDLAHRSNQMSLLEARLKRALIHGGLKLVYQPIVDMKTGEACGVEALLRFDDGDGPQLSPTQIIPVAEAAGLIGQVGEWVVREACRQHLAWTAEGLPPIAVAVNVSPLQFRQRNFAERLSEIVRESGIDAQYLQIEITESAVMDDVEQAITTLQSLKATGIKVALDDFGTGYSSLSRLGQLPLDKLKVDQSFIKHIDHDLVSQAITDAVIALARTLKLQVVGEGIDSDASLAYLGEHGCDQGQGYLFTRPLPQKELASWFRAHERLQ